MSINMIPDVKADVFGYEQIINQTGLFSIRLRYFILSIGANSLNPIEP
jgi:hypothetical protein